MKTGALGEAELQKLAATLRAMRGTASYPPTAAALMERAGVFADPAELSKRVAKKYWSTSAVEPSKSRKKPPGYYPDALVFVSECLDEDLACDAMIVHVVKLARAEDARIHDVAALKDPLPSSKDRARSLQHRFEIALSRRLKAADSPPLPEEVAMLREKNRPLLFLVSDVLEAVSPRHRDAAARPRSPDKGTSDQPFPVVFSEAFDELDQKTGKRNYVLLHDLRQRLAMIPRPDFDAGLNELRRSQKYSLDSADGRHIRLTPEQIDAGIREAGSVLVYVARR